jgi:hypothetical protein
VVFQAGAESGLLLSRGPQSELEGPSHRRTSTDRQSSIAVCTHPKAAPAPGLVASLDVTSSARRIDLIIGPVCVIQRITHVCTESNFYFLRPPVGDRRSTSPAPGYPGCSPQGLRAAEGTE